MSSDVLFGLYVFASAAVLLGLLALWGFGRSLRGRNDRRQQLVDPEGRVWTTRLHWGRPGAGLGVGRRLFPPTPATDGPLSRTAEESAPVIGQPASSDAALAGSESKVESKEKPKREKLSWFDGLEIFGDGVAAIVFTVGILIAVVIVVLLALELLLILGLAAVFALARLLFGHPWIIEINRPDAASTFTPVRGLRRAVDAHREIRSAIEAGVDAPEIIASYGGFADRT